MKKCLNFIKSVGKAYFKVYAACYTFKLANGKTLFCEPNGSACVY